MTANSLQEDSLEAPPSGSSIATLKQQADLKQPLILPWHPQKTIAPGTLFHSRLCDSEEGPWSKESPFKPDSLAATPFEFVADDGGVASFRSVASSESGSSSEHLSVSLGVTVGLPFLSVSVTGSYDKDVQKNSHANKTSTRSSYRLGTVRLQSVPALTDQAIITAKYDGGIAGFEQRYGDYYVAGYRLGGDNGLLLSSSAGSEDIFEQYGIEVKVKVLFIKASKKWTHDERRSSSRASVAAIGYDTLSYRKVAISAEASRTDETQHLVDEARKLVAMGESLGARVEVKAQELGVLEGRSLTYEDCRKLTEAGLVVELVLLPVRTMRTLLLWALDDNII